MLSICKALISSLALGEEKNAVWAVGISKVKPFKPTRNSVIC